MELNTILSIPIARRPNCASVLIVGGTQELYKKIEQTLTTVSAEGNYLLNTSVIDKLPLSGNETSDHFEVDLIVLLVRADDRNTFENVKTSLACIPVDFFQGRIIMVVHKPKSMGDICVEYERISLLAESYTCPVLWDNMTYKTEPIARQLFHKIKFYLPQS